MASSQCLQWTQPTIFFLFWCTNVVAHPAQPHCLPTFVALYSGTTYKCKHTPEWFVVWHYCQLLYAYC